MLAWPQCRWAQDSYSRSRRTVDIWGSLARLRLQSYLADAKWSYLGGFTETKQSARRRALAVWLRGALLDLGRP